MIKSKREKHPSFHINGLVDLHHEVETSIFLGGVTVLSTMLVISKIQSFDHKMSIFMWLPAKAIATMRAEKEVMPL